MMLLAAKGNLSPGPAACMGDGREAHPPGPATCMGDGREAHPPGLAACMGDGREAHPPGDLSLGAIRLCLHTPSSHGDGALVCPPTLALLTWLGG